MPPSKYPSEWDKLSCTIIPADHLARVIHHNIMTHNFFQLCFSVINMTSPPCFGAVEGEKLAKRRCRL